MKNVKEVVNEILVKLFDKSLVMITKDNYDLDDLDTIEDDELRSEIENIFNTFGYSYVTNIKEIYVTKIEESPYVVTLYLDKTLEEIINLIKVFIDNLLKY